MSVKPPIRSSVPVAKRYKARILVIGGTGFIGSQIIPILAGRGHKIILAPSSKQYTSLFESKEQWSDEIKNVDVVLLLSVVNNDINAPLSLFKAVNVELPLQLAALMTDYSGKRLVVFGSDHADQDAISGPYAQSKAELQRRLMALDESRVTMLILSPVHGTRFVKRLSFLDCLPKLLRGLAITVFGALRPLTHVKLIADAIETSIQSESTKTEIVRVNDDQDDNFIYRTATRTFDICFAIVTLCLFFWLMLFLSVLIRLGSAGPALFKQQRVGRYGRVFTCYKFRTMHLGTQNVATHEASAAVITPIGKRLRAWKLDELPQIFNILANQMSLVGPRPCLPTQTELIGERAKLGVLLSKPGITGWSQIKNIDMSEPTRLAMSDAEYRSKRSIPLYVRIALLTFLGKGKGDRIR